jgi:hypothetical protein
MRKLTRRTLRHCEGQSGFCERPALYRFHRGPVRWEHGHTLCFRCYRVMQDKLRTTATLVA